MEKAFWRGTEAEDFTSQTSVTSDLSVVWLLSGLALTDCIKENSVHCEFVFVNAHVLKSGVPWPRFLPLQSTSSECNKIAMLRPFVTKVCL